jgi:hypothetical protein
VRRNCTKALGQVRIAPGFIAEAVALIKADKPHWRGKLRANPVTGHRFVVGVDPIRREIVDAAMALRARARFAELHPDLPALPLCWNEREALKARSEGVYIGHFVAWFAWSLASVGYDLDGHPTFENYVRDQVLANPELRPFLPADVVDRFSPRGVK